MREKTVVIQCEFEPAGKAVSEILEESFVLFLHRTLANPQERQCNPHDEWSLISRRKLCTQK